MFYVTQIKSVGQSGVIDVQGRRLNFIGYLPVKAGDSVYTDGNVIFGNAPPKGAPAIFDNPSGIPVLADEDSSGKNELRGYFTNRGKYKRFSIAGDDWITNSEKKYSHDEEDDGDDDDIIDAEITDDGDEFIVKKGIYQDSRTLETTKVEAHLFDSYLFYHDKIELSRLCLWIWVNGFIVVKQSLGSEDFPNEQTSVKVLKNGEIDKEIDLEPFAKDVEARALQCAAEIMKKSYTEEDVQNNDLEPVADSTYEGKILYSNVSYTTPEEITANSRLRTTYYVTNYGYGRVPYTPSGTINEGAYSPPDEPFIAYTSVHILTSNFDEDGFKGTVFATTYGYCFPHIQPRFLFISTSLVSGKEFFRIYEWKCVPFGVSCIYKVDGSNATFEPIAFRDFGGVDSDIRVIEGNYPLGVGTGSGIDTDILANSVLSDRHIELLTNFEVKDFGEVFLPVGEGFYKMDKFGRLTFYDSKKNLVAENIPVHDDFYHVEIEHGEFSPVTYYFNDKPLLSCKIYTSDGEVEEAYIRPRNVTWIDTGKTVIQGELGTMPPMDGYYIKQANGTLEPLNFTPLFYQFKNGDCLCGVRGGKLYLKTSDGVEQVGEGVKNFRLRELKNIRKAKK